MGRASQRKRINRETASLKSQSSASRFRPGFRRVAAGIGFIVALVGLLSALISSHSKILITPGEAVQEHDVSTIPFEVTNDSPYSIYWIAHSCEIYSAILSDGSRIDDMRSLPAIQRQERLDAGQGRTIFCPILGKDDPKAIAADLGIRVTFRPFYLPIHQTTESRFQIDADRSGRLRALRRNFSDEHTLH